MKQPIAHLQKATDAEFSQQMRRALQALPDVPPALERSALALFPAPSALAAAAASLGNLAHGVLTHITAVLSFDSWATPALAAGMRSLRSPTRHLLFSAQGRDIDLRIAPQTPAAEVFALTGQILGPDETGSIEVRRSGDAAGVLHSTALDDLGEFRIEGLAPGLYALSLRTATEQIELPPFEVGEAAGEPVR
jgi:hypothetical protein